MQFFNGVNKHSTGTHQDQPRLTRHPSGALLTHPNRQQQGFATFLRQGLINHFFEARGRSINFLYHFAVQLVL